MKAERDWREPAMRSIPVSTSFESVIDVFSFILLSYHRHITMGRIVSRTSTPAVSLPLLWRMPVLTGRSAANRAEAGPGSRQTHPAIPCIREP